MYADRYGPRPVNPGSLSLSVSIVGGLLAAVMLSPTIIEHVTKDDPLRTYTVPPVTPPPPPDNRPKVEPKDDPRPTRIATPDTIVDTPPVTDSRVAQPDPGPLPDLGLLDGGVTVIDPPKPPPPVLTGAQPDPRVDFRVAAAVAVALDALMGR